MIKLIEMLSSAPDGQLDASLAKECSKFLLLPDTGKDPVLFLRNLRDKCVYCAGASNAVMTLFAIFLDKLPPEPETEKEARRASLEASWK